MNLNYAIFRSEPIMTIPDLAQIGSHNKREKKAYNSNSDIKRELSKNNNELVPLTEKYVKGFYNLTNEYRKQYEEKQNKKYAKEVSMLEKENNDLRQENNSLIYRLNYLFELLKIVTMKMNLI